MPRIEFFSARCDDLHPNNAFPKRMKRARARKRRARASLTLAVWFFWNWMSRSLRMPPQARRKITISGVMKARL